MAINVVSVHYNGGFFPGIILLTLQPMFSPKSFDNFYLKYGSSEDFLDAFRFFFKLRGINVSPNTLHNHRCRGNEVYFSAYGRLSCSSCVPLN